MPWLTVSRDSAILREKIHRYDLILCGAGLSLRKKKNIERQIFDTLIQGGEDA